jgi:hypothetical protein
MMIATSQALDTLLNFDSPAKFFVVLAVIGSVAATIITVVVQLSRYASHRADLNFKREMVERGLSVEEIERVLAAKSADTTQVNR